MYANRRGTRWQNRDTVIAPHMTPADISEGPAFATRMAPEIGHRSATVASRQLSHVLYQGKYPPAKPGALE